MLTEATVKAARPLARPFKMTDGDGLHLFVTPSGHRSWRIRYRWNGKEKLAVAGTYPSVGLGNARTLCRWFRDQLERGIEPKGEQLRAQVSSPPELSSSFAAVARQWHARRRARWSTKHADDVLASLERDVFPAIGAKPLVAIDASEVLELLLAVEARGCIESARRIRERISGVFRLGILLKLCAADPAALIADELSPRPLQRPQPALLGLDAARALLAAADATPAAAIVKLASLFLALTAVRMAALRGARWDEFCGLDTADATWRVPPERMKLTKVKKTDQAAEHVVPLSRQAIDVLGQLRLLTGGGVLLFPGRDPARPIGEGAIGALYDQAGFAGRHVPHGWRATFSTILNERFPEDQSLIDRALAHAGNKGKVEAAYNRAQHYERLRDVFQRWADLVHPL